MNFNDYGWHDSVIKKIEIDRDEFRKMDSNKKFRELVRQLEKIKIEK
ncbi:hypothetical protein [Flavobacterium movens]